MRIREIRFKNLNSLYGEWVIDFTHPIYETGGLFALTGPTGAGKSTVLDAVCLALYGATPRLGRITKSTNEIMSRQTGECYAEVLFESQTGVYRCHWEQRRARKSSDGNLQEPEHQISDAMTNKLIETKKSLVGPVIEEKTGMDFERFTRSILLAQGSFDTFLKASPEDKSKILEQITGMEIYTEISRRVHERKREEQERLKWLQMESDGIVFLDAKGEAALNQEFEATEIREREVEALLLKTQQALVWRETMEAIREETQQLIDDEAQIKSEWDVFQPHREILGRAERAFVLVPPYTLLVNLRAEQVEDKKQLAQEEAALLEATSIASTLLDALQDAENDVAQRKDALQQNLVIIQRVRGLDQQLESLRKRILESKESCAEEDKKIKTLLQSLERGGEDLRQLQADEKRVLDYLEENTADEWLVSGLAGIEEQRMRWFSTQEAIRENKTRRAEATEALRSVEHRLSDAIEQRRCLEIDLKMMDQDIEKEKKELETLLKGRLIREYRTEKESLLKEMAYVRKIEELESHRSKLEEGVPCPLCGSTSHPFAKGNVPICDELGERERSLSDFIERAEQQELVIRDREGNRGQAQNTLNQSLILEQALLNERGAHEKELNSCEENLDTLITSSKEIESSISSKIAPLGENVAHMETLIERLTVRLNLWKEKRREHHEIGARCADIRGELARLQSLVEAHRQALTEKQDILSRIEFELNAINEERIILYGDKDPDVEEAALNKEVARAEELETHVREEHVVVWQKVTKLGARVESLKKRVDERSQELVEREICFKDDLQTGNFSDEGDFTRSLISAEERACLVKRAKELDTNLAEVVAKRKDREARLQQEESKKISDSTIDELEQKRNYEDALLAEVRALSATLKHRLLENSRAKEKAAAKASEQEAQVKELKRWNALHELIGSSDGKKFRNFAQGLTFDLMILHANYQLQKMSDRYLLMRDAQHPLALNVLDNYQAGEIRTTQNLSGGECFIVSLALALGLSKMASQKVRVDSLFLDEGFGTLDEESLDTALEALSGLQHDGKLIGVISHVLALKERIPAQIKVAPQSSGRSALLGPGCVRIR